jgi:hypothetical protein
MVRGIVGIAATLWCLAGCGSSMPSPTTTPVLSEAQQCVRGGGWWRDSLGICDMQGTGVEMH